MSLRPLAALALALPTLTAIAPVAADAPPTRRLGLDAAVLVPIGDYADAASVAGGPLVRAEVPAGPATITARAGAIFHALKVDGASLVYAPIWVGGRYPIGGAGLFAAGEVGVTIAHASADTGFGDGSDTKTELGASLGVGLRRGALTVTGGLMMPDLGDATALFASVGYDLASF